MDERRATRTKPRSLAPSTFPAGSLVVRQCFHDRMPHVHPRGLFKVSTNRLIHTSFLCKYRIPIPSKLSRTDLSYDEKPKIIFTHSELEFSANNHDNCKTNFQNTRK